MANSFYGDVLAEDGLEELELRAAQALAGRSGLADRAVVLDQDDASTVWDDLGEVALGAAQLGQLADPHLDTRRACRRDGGAVGLSLNRGSPVEYPLESLFAEGLSH
jgi:hypothetical protein